MSEVVDQLQGSLIKMENLQKLLELKKDLIGVDNLVVPGRVRLKSTGEICLTFCFCLDFVTNDFFPQEFIRLGCLSKLSGKGLQQRMFFLVTSHFLHLISLIELFS